MKSKKEILNRFYEKVKGTHLEALAKSFLNGAKLQQADKNLINSVLG